MRTSDLGPDAGPRTEPPGRARGLGRIALAGLASLAACAGPARAPAVSAHGTMREVLREGRHEGRVDVLRAAGPTTVGVGALAGLAGEVTIVGGRALVATAVAGGRAATRPARDGDRAALLVVADVPVWEDVPLGDVASYHDLDRALAERLRARGVDPAEPTPVRVRGRAPRLSFHVIAGACPIADPTGPAPWRFSGAADDVELVGFYVEGAAGRLTHHTHRSHLHAITREGTGHLDEVALVDAVLSLPRAE